MGRCGNPFNQKVWPPRLARMLASTAPSIRADRARTNIERPLRTKGAWLFPAALPVEAPPPEMAATAVNGTFMLVPRNRVNKVLARSSHGAVSCRMLPRPPFPSIDQPRVLWDLAPRSRSCAGRPRYAPFEISWPSRAQDRTSNLAPDVRARHKPSA